VITVEKVRIICGRCQIKIPCHLRVKVSKHVTVRPLNLLPPRFENQMFWGNYRKVFSLRWRINHFALNLLPWVCLNIIQINKSHCLIFVFLTLHA